MELWVITLYGLAMALGLLGVLIPGLPGLLLVGVVAGVWAFDTGEAVAWVVFGVVVLVLALGTLAKYVLPARSLREAGAPRSTLFAGAALAIVGFFVIPVVGLIIGAIVGVWLAELRRLRSAGDAWRSTLATGKSIGIGMVLELLAGILAVGIWLAAALAMR